MPNPTTQDAPLDLVATLRRAIAAHQNGQLDAAETLYRAVLERDRHQFDALQMLGVVEAQRGRLDEARKLISRALKANPQSAEAHTNLGRVLNELGLSEQALESFDKALAINPLLIVALSNRGVILNKLGRYEEALQSYERALALAPNNIDIIFNRGNVLRQLGRLADALAAYDEVLGYHAGYHDARIARANILQEMQRDTEALEELDRFLVDHPHHVMALNNRGNLLMRRRLYRKAAADFATALQLDDKAKYVLGNFVLCRLYGCDWPGIDEARAVLSEEVQLGKSVAMPLVLLGASHSPADQLVCAQTYVADRYPPVAAPPFRARRHERIRLAYVSGDLNEHAVAFLTAGLFERHDRSRFETTAISLSPERPSPMLDRLKGGFERFITVTEKTDEQVVALMRELEIDIAVDLMGHTRGARTGIFARRAAPIQVNFLGYGGTMGADYIDYIIADEFLIPEGSRQYYSEQPVYLPDTAQVNDADRKLPAAPTRGEAGLPETGVVYCAFNASYKFTPQLFLVWMRLLRDVEGSTLWVLGDDLVAESLRREAAALGIAPDRLVFAPQVRPDDHLARCALADVFLDTLPANGGATTSDMLWSGVPVVTCAGEAMVSRVSGSLLRAIGLPELITHSLDDYESLARELGRNPELLARTKAKLKANRATYPLFDTARFTRHLEAAFTGMWERYERGEPPAPLTVAPVG